MTQHAEAVETRISKEPPPAKISAADYQAGREPAKAEGPGHALPEGMASDECLLKQYLGIGATSERTPAVMTAIGNATEEAKSLFPNEPNTGDIVHDMAMPVSAAYRYVMNKEGLDDYSKTSAADIALLEKTSPGSVQKLDEFVADQIKRGLVPQGTPKECAS